jgi:hypothetical protein
MQEKDIHNKLNKFSSICGTLRRTLKTKTKKTTQIKFYKVMALPVLLYGSETWTIKTKDMSKIQATEMRYLRSVKGCTKLDHIKNEDIRKELDIDSTQYKIANYRKKWIEHLDRMPDERIPKQILKYKPKGHRDQGRPWKRWNE